MLYYFETCSIVQSEPITLQLCMPESEIPYLQNGMAQFTQLMVLQCEMKDSLWCILLYILGMQKNLGYI